MEATPSLACANKCVFCWRHHTNPVGTEWRWVTDPPELIVGALIEGHRKMIKQLRGVPGTECFKFIGRTNEPLFLTELTVRQLDPLRMPIVK